MRHAFTLVELLVATSIFMAVTLIATMAVSQFSRAGREAEQALALHARHAALAKLLDERLGRATAFAGIWWRQEAATSELVWMHTVHRLYDRAGMFGRDLMILYYRDDYTLFHSSRRFWRSTDLVWGGLQWHDGILHMGHSMLQHHSSDRTFNNNRFNYTRVTPQQRMVHLVGSPTAPPKPGEGARLGPLHAQYSNKATPLDSNTYLDSLNDGDPFPYDDWFSKNLGYGIFGDKQPEDKTFAVLNPDGRGVNKDWMFLAGSTDPDDTYHDLRLPVEQNIEFIEMTAYCRRGSLLTTEEDSLQDGSASLDWAGLPRTGTVALGRWDIDTESYLPARLDDRPARLQFSWLLHAIPLDHLDEADLDGNRITNERLADAIRAVVLSDASLVDTAARREAFARLVHEQGFAAATFTHVVELEL